MEAVPACNLSNPNCRKSMCHLKHLALSLFNDQQPCSVKDGAFTGFLSVQSVLGVSQH